MECNKRKLIIEFNGLPGSGKSTVHKTFTEKYSEKLNIAEKFNYYGSGSKGKFGSLINIIKYGGIFPALWVIRYIASFGKLKECGFKYFLNCYIFFASYNRFQKNEKANILLVDQGFVQSLISIIYIDEAVVNKEMKKLISMMFEKHNILVVNCMSDDEICIERINDRNLAGRFDLLSKDKLSVSLKKQQKTFALVRDYLKAEGINSVELDMRSSIDENCEILYNLCKGLIK